jgi:ABC-type glutathione transport system ATPase component
VGEQRQALVGRDLVMDYVEETALNGLSVELTPGAAPIGVIGPSGSGKTTLVRLLMGWEAPTSGTVVFGDVNPARPPRSRKKAVRAALRGVHEERDPSWGYQDTAVRPTTKVEKLAARTGRSPGMTMDELFDLVGLDTSVLTRVPHDVSVGEQQRLAMAWALMTDPDVLILDEPATALHPQAAEEVLHAVVGHAMERGTAVLMVSHNLRLMGKIVDSVIALYEGEEVARGPLDQLLKAPDHPYLRELADIWAEEAAIDRPGEHPAIGPHKAAAPITRDEIFRGLRAPEGEPQGEE